MDDRHAEFHAALADRFVLSVLDARREEEERRTLETEHRIAATLQRSLIPALPELEVVGLEGCYLPGTDGLEVGGDWYDAIPLPDGSITLVIGDVVGKGVAAAAQMGQLRNALVRWCRAGHLPALVRRADGRVDSLAGDGSPPMGVFEGVVFRESADHLEVDDVVVLYTDGLIEKPGEDIDVSIEALAARIGSLEVGPGFVDAVVAPLTDTARRDDVAVLVLST